MCLMKDPFRFVGDTATRKAHQMIIKASRDVTSIFFPSSSAVLSITILLLVFCLVSKQHTYKYYTPERVGPLSKWRDIGTKTWFTSSRKVWSYLRDVKRSREFIDLFIGVSSYRIRLTIHFITIKKFNHLFLFLPIFLCFSDQYQTFLYLNSSSICLAFARPSDIFFIFQIIFYF